MTITLGEAKAYLKPDDPLDTSEDGTIQDLLDGAVAHIETMLKRPILDANMTTETTWTVPASIRIAVYMLVAHWYENRLPVGQVTKEMDFAISAIVKPHKFYTV